MRDCDAQDSAPSAWYHCGVCSEVFRGAIGEEAPRVCPACANPLRRVAADKPRREVGGLPPAGVQRNLQMGAGRMALDPLRSGARPAPGPAGGVKSSEPRAVRGSGSRRSRKGLILVSLLGLWMLGLIWYVVQLNGRRNVARAPERALAAPAGGRSAEDLSILRAAMPGCQRAWLNFLRAGSPEARAQSAKDGYLVVGAMQRYYGENPAPNLSTVPVQRLGEVLKTPDGLAIETLWATAEGQYEVVFFNQKGEWRMDWKNHVRHSEMEWPLYLAGVGEDTGEFRLFVRERRGQARADGMISVVFYLPRYGRTEEFGPQSPEFLVALESETGRRLTAVLARAKQGKGAYESKLAELDPAGMARVRVRIRRQEVGGKRSFQLEELVAGHWLDLADPGIDEPVEVSEAPAPGG